MRVLAGLVMPGDLAWELGRRWKIAAQWVNCPAETHRPGGAATSQARLDHAAKRVFFEKFAAEIVPILCSYCSSCNNPIARWFTEEVPNSPNFQNISNKNCCPPLLRFPPAVLLRASIRHWRILTIRKVSASGLEGRREKLKSKIANFIYLRLASQTCRPFQD